MTASREGQPAADNQLQTTLQQWQTAAAVLVSGGKHWVCVIGYTFDANNLLTGFIINDPAYDGGGMQQGVSLSQWDTAYTPVAGGVTWDNQIVEVGDPRPVEDAIQRAPRPVVRSGERILAPDEAVKLALEQARAHFGELPNLRRALDAGKPGQPKLVARLDREGSYYYLVPLETEARGEHQAIGAIMLDARLGDVLSVSAAEQPFPLWPLTPDAVRERVTAAPIPVYEPLQSSAGRLLEATFGAGVTTNLRVESSARLADSGRRGGWLDTVSAALAAAATPASYLTLKADDIEIEPVWRWLPCGGVSPFHPYYEVRTPWRSVYVNARSGLIRTRFDLCAWDRLGA